MRHAILIVFLLTSISSWATSQITCRGETEDNYPFTLEITHLNEFDGPYQKFTSQFSIAGQTIKYQGRVLIITKAVGRNQYEDIGFEYLIDKSPPVSTKEFVNLIRFSFLTGTPIHGTNLHTELRYNGRYSGHNECFPESEMFPGGCYPKFNGKNFKVHMSCKEKTISDFEDCFQECIKSKPNANHCAMECTDAGGNGA